MMNRSLSLSLLSVAVVGVLAGCPDITVPPDAIIRCGEGGVCPAGTSCNDDINLCVPDDPAETDAPVVSGVAFAPDAGRAGTAFTVSFAVDEALGRAPVVSVNTGAAAPVALVASAGDPAEPGSVWTFGYTPDGTEDEGVRSVTVEVIDLLGNARTQALAPGFTFDFTPPAITDPNLDTLIANPALSFNLRVTGAVRVTATGDVEDDQDLVVTDDNVDVDVVFTAGDGDKALVLEAEDDVGNVDVLELTFTLDTSVPFSQPTLTPRAGQTAIKNNDTLDVSGQVTPGATVVRSVLVDENAAVIHDVTGVIVNATTGAVSGSIAVGALGAASSVRLQLTVLTGVVQSPDDQSRSNTLVVDNLPPQSPSCTLPARVISSNVTLALAADGFVDVEVVGDVVEPRAFLPLAGGAQSGNVALILSNGEGDKTLTANFRDGAHNLASCSATTNFDSGAPIVTDVVLVPPAGQTAVRSTQLVTVTGSVDVAGATITTARLLNGSFGFIGNVAGLSVTGTSIGGSFVVDDVVSGALPAGVVLEVTVTDGTLNSIPVRSPQLDVDDLPPTAPVLTAPADAASFNVEIDVGGCSGAEEVAVSGDVQVNDGVFVAFPADNVVSVVLTAGQGEKVVTAQCRDRAFNLSATDSVTINLTTDDVLSLPTITLPGLQTAVKNGDTVVVGGTGEVGATVTAVRVVNAATGAVVQALAANTVSLAGNGALSGSFVTAGLPNAQSVALEVILRARGRDSVAADSRSGAVVVDLTNPAAPVLGSLRLVETAASANDPARLVEAVDNTLTASGLSGAVVDGARVDLCADASCVTVIDSVDVAATGFSATTFAHRANHDVFVRAVDDAGNRSGTTRVAVPRVTFTSVAPAAANVDDDVVVSFTTNVAVVQPVVRVDGNLAAFVSQSGNAFVYRYDTVGNEGDGVTVVRVFAEDDSGAAAGTIGTDATTTILDFTAPVINAARLTLTQNDPGTDDVVSGIAGAVADAEDAIVDVDVVGAGSAAANADGSFANLSAGDNLSDTLTFRATDDAGNNSTVTLTNDRAAPVISQIVVPAVVKDGTAFTISFRLVDARALRTIPVVTVGGRAASKSTGNATESPLDEVFTYSFTANAGSDTEGSAAVAISFVDAVGNAGTGSGAVVFDFTAPVINAANVSMNQNDPGTADTVSGIAGAVLDAVDTSVAVLVVGAGSGTAAADGSFSALGAGDNAADTVTLRATDDAGNQSTLTLTNDRAAPVLSQQVAPEAAKNGDTATISFRLVDARGLRADPTVTVGGRPATRVSGNRNEAPLDEVFSYSFLVNQAQSAEGIAAVAVSFEDAVGNSGTGADTINLDYTAPVVRNTTPGDQVLWNLEPAALGTALDDGAVVPAVDSGIDHVEVTVQDCSVSASPCTGNFLNGAAFNSATPVVISANVTNARGDWSAPINPAPFADHNIYELVFKAFDVAGNPSTATQFQFLYNDVTLAQPTNLQAAVVSGNTVRLTWTAPVSPATGFKVYYTLQSASAPPYDGTGATQGTSPFAIGNVVTVDVTGLAPGDYFFAVTGVNANGESAYSNEVSVSF